MFFIIATYSTSHHRRRRQRDCLRSIVRSRLENAITQCCIGRINGLQRCMTRCVVDSKLHRGSNATPAYYDQYRIKFKIAKFAFLVRSSATMHTVHISTQVAQCLHADSLSYIAAFSLFRAACRTVYMVYERFTSRHQPFLTRFLKPSDVVTVFRRFRRLLKAFISVMHS